MHVLVLESPSISSGVEATLAAALSCASAAIADAGIAMSGLAVGTVAAAFTSEGGGDGGAPPQRSSSSSTIRLDPDAREGAEASAIVSVGTLPALDLVTDAWMTGEAEVEEVVAVSVSNIALALQNLFRLRHRAAADGIRPVFLVVSFATPVAQHLNDLVLSGPFLLNPFFLALLLLWQMIDAAVKASAQAHGVVAQALLQGVSERERAAAASVPA